MQLEQRRQAMLQLSSELSTILLPAKMRLILEVLWYIAQDPWVAYPM